MRKRHMRVQAGRRRQIQQRGHLRSSVDRRAGNVRGSSGEVGDRHLCLRSAVRGAGGQRGTVISRRCLSEAPRITGGEGGKGSGRQVDAAEFAETPQDDKLSMLKALGLDEDVFVNGMDSAPTDGWSMVSGDSGSDVRAIPRSCVMPIASIMATPARIGDVQGRLFKTARPRRAGSVRCMLGWLAGAANTYVVPELDDSYCDRCLWSARGCRPGGSRTSC